MRTVIVVMLLLSFILVSCQLGAIGKGKSQLPDFSRIYSGKEGIAVRFAESLPPSEVTVADTESERRVPIKIALLVENKGAADISQGTMRFKADGTVEAVSLGDGYISIKTEPDFIELTDAYRTEPRAFKLLGKSITSPEGEKDILAFDAAVKYFEGAAKKRNSKLTVNLCYKYQTRASAAVCINSDVFGLSKTAPPCKVAPVSLKDQGAPVAVTRVVPEMKIATTSAGDRVRPEFKVYLSNVGGGKIVNVDANIRSVCTASPVYEDGSVIKGAELSENIRVNAKLGDEALDCAKKTDLSALEPVICKTREGSELALGGEAFVRELSLVVEYGYTDTLEKTVVLTRRGKS